MKKTIATKRELELLAADFRVVVESGFTGLAEHVPTSRILGEPFFAADEVKIVQQGYRTRGEVVLDYWGEPIWLRSSDQAASELVFVSFGPNRQDDGGRGDDLVQVLELSP